MALEITDETFEDVVLKSEKPVLVDRGDSVYVKMQVHPFFERMLYNWTVEIRKTSKNKKPRKLIKFFIKLINDSIMP